MPTLPETFESRLAAGAAAAGRAETDFRTSYADRLKALERARVFANRRLNLMRELSGGIRAVEDAPTAIKAGERVLEANFSLSAGNPAHADILAAFAPVSTAVERALHAAGEPDHDAVLDALASFETWYEARTGKPFLALYDVYMPETPVVDF